MQGSIPHLIFALTLLLLTAGTYGYRTDQDDSARAVASLGFVLFGSLLSLLAIGYATSGRSDWVFLFGVSATGALLSFQGLYLIVTGWDRAGQLTATVAGIGLIILPFELFPVLQHTVQELFTLQTRAVIEALGYSTTLESYSGAEATLRHENGYGIIITRECTGIDGVAFFGGILLAARTTWRRKAKGIAFMLAAVYLVNSVRLVFVNAAVGGDWFGPLLTGSTDLQLSYVVAEVAIGQTSVIVASVLGFLYVSRWIPDILEFASDLLGSFSRLGTAVNTRLNPN